MNKVFHALPSAPQRKIEATGDPVESLAVRISDRSLAVGAVAVACGGRLGFELLGFLSTFRFRNPAVPVYVLTDADGAEVVRCYLRESGDDPAAIVTDERSDAELLALVDGATVAEKNDYWSAVWIAAKIEAIYSGLVHFGPGCGVLLCDSDLVFTDALPALEYDADLVLSEHHGPNPDRTTPREHGIYNAGMVLVRALPIVKRWREMFEAGTGGFYEQGCLEDLAREFVTDTFPGSLNWGGWRRENLLVSGRRPAVLHTHALGELAIHRGAFHDALRFLAVEAMNDAEISRETPDKVAIIHFPKAAGCSLAGAIKTAISRRRGVRYLSGFDYRPGGDWTPEELGLIHRGMMFPDSPRVVVDSHVQNWPGGIVEAMAADGWEIVALYRPIRERLVSFFFWSQQALRNRGCNPMSGPVVAAKTLEDHLAIMIRNPRYKKEVGVPEWSDLITRWAPATDEGITNLIRDVWAFEMEIERRNGSDSPGYAACVERGLISAELAAEVENSPIVQAWDALAVRLGFDGAASV